MSHHVFEEFRVESDESTFAADLLAFVLGQHQISWEWTYRCKKKEATLLFRPIIGLAVLNYALRHASTFRNLRGAFFPQGLWSLEAFPPVLHQLLHRPRGQFAVVIVLSAFLCHTGVFLSRMGDYRFGNDFVVIIAAVVETQLKKDAQKWMEFVAFAEEVNRSLRIPEAA